jgi:hypothetical protein
MRRSLCRQFWLRLTVDTADVSSVATTSCIASRGGSRGRRYGMSGHRTRKEDAIAHRPFSDREDAEASSIERQATWRT